MTREHHSNAQKTVNFAYAGIQPRTDLQGKQYINLLRCSQLSQADTSPEGQQEVNNAYSVLCGMGWAGDDIYAEGVSGSQTFNREDIEAILQRKRTLNDFEVVVVFEYGRMTRGGIRHGNSVEDDLKKAGITLVSSTELIPDGPIGDMIKAVKHFSNQQQAIQISKAVARGLGQSLAKGTRPAASRTPYGLDRLYLGPDGKRRMLLRWEGDIQLRIDPNTMLEIGRAIRPPVRKRRKKGERKLLSRERPQRFMGYVKQPDEISQLVAGNNKNLEIVRWAWEMHYLHGWGAHRLIHALRDRPDAPRAADGGRWCMHSMLYMLTNPIYLGIEVRNRWTRALYNMTDADGPIAVSVDQDKLQQEGRTAVPTSQRPRDEWELVDVPGLKDILPPQVREVAMRRIMAAYDRADVRGGYRRTHKHDATSPYVLSGIVHSGITGHEMNGSTVTKKLRGGIKKQYRYYYDYSAGTFADKGAMARRIPAEPLEEAVIPAVLEVLVDSDWVVERVKNHVAKSAMTNDGEEDLRKALIAERQRITTRLKRMFDTLGDVADAELAESVTADKTRLLTIRSELARLDMPVERPKPTPDEAVAAVIEELQNMPKQWRSLPRKELRALLAKFITDLKVDLRTLAVEFTVRIPPFVQSAVETTVHGKVRVQNRWLWQSSLDAHAAERPKIDQIECQGRRRGNCYVCQRLRQAA
jgi:hypothetical protein